ncbi:copper homeostasis protein CutC [Streptomyces sp. TP-A0874]|uniref:copper homeostasis protein CutC n=1 Tax=Streptomyces sp. TP-A0874 TaxID=549819 RepID=UPI000852B3D7|nr:copper homeostasis protein CutC [Streptomyces sp. TP-A0874]
MSRPLLEVIALDARDAAAAQDGGADRLELVADMDAGGLTPPGRVFSQVRAAVDLPLRVMLRSRGDFAAGDIDALCATAESLLEQGAREFVLGFLDAHHHADLVAVERVVEVIEGCPWTFHRAIDHAADRDALRKQLADLPGLDAYLTAGAPQGVDTGLTTLRTEASRSGQPGYEPRLMVGGGLRLEHLAELRAAGVGAFHIGGAARPEGWRSPVDAAAVRAWRERL